MRLPPTLLLALPACTGAVGAVDTARVAEAGADTAALADPAPPRSAPIVVHAVRHCEKAEDDEDPGLTEEGAARAEALAVLMADVPLAAIYATDLRRTQETVAPTAEAHGLPVVTELDPEEELAAWILAAHDGDTVLHAGHSYTLGDFMAALGVAEPPSVDGYGQLWTLTVGTEGGVDVVESRFGE